MANPAREVDLEVRTFPIAEPKNSTVAFASVTIDNLVGINGIRIIDGENGLFVSMPQAKDSLGSFRDIAFPVAKGLRQAISETILEDFTAQKDRVSVKVQLQEGAEKSRAAKETAKDAKEAAKGAKEAVADATTPAKAVARSGSGSER